MFISELFMIAEMESSSDVVEPTPAGYGSEKEDGSTLKLSDMRKTRLTLAQINKLRMLNDIRTVEHSQKVKSLAAQYKAPAADAGGM